MFRIFGACTAALLAVGGLSACGEDVRRLGRPAPIGDTAAAQADPAAESAPRRAAAGRRPESGSRAAQGRGVVRYKTVTKTEKIPFTTERVEDPSLAEGTRAVRSFGVPGSKALTFRVAWRDGRPIGRELVKVEVVEPPVPEVVVIGTKPAPSPAPPSQRVEKAPPLGDGRLGSDEDERSEDDTDDDGRERPDAEDETRGENCHPNYGGCVPRGATDVDCLGGPGNGPRYIRGPVIVLGPDVYGLDADDDGVGCEN